MMMAVAGLRDLPVRGCSRRRHFAAGDGRRCRRGADLGHALMRTGWFRCRKPPNWAAAPARSPGGGCQFLGTAATSQVVGEALGLSLPHSALAPSGQPVWLDMARRSARALHHLDERKLATREILTAASIQNAMVVHAAFGGSTNLLLHIPAIAHAAGLKLPTVDDWIDVNRRVPAARQRVAERPGASSDRARFSRRRRAGSDVASARLNCSTPACSPSPEKLWAKIWTGGKNPNGAAASANCCTNWTAWMPDEVIFSPEQARARGLTSTLVFPRGNLAPEGSV